MPFEQEIINEQFQEDRESWKVVHDELKKKCWEVEDMVRRGLRLYAYFRAYDENWSRKVQAGEAAFSEERVRHVRAAYEWWLKPCDIVLKRVEDAERTYGTIDGAKQFREARLFTLALLRVPLDRLIDAIKESELAA